MTDIVNALFFVNIAWLATHELDAIRHHEWRIFFHRIPVDDLTAYRAFVAVHVPFFALITAWSREPAFQIAFSVFLIVHAGLHWYFRSHPAYEFEGWFSNLIIFGGAPLGALHLLLLISM